MICKFHKNDVSDYQQRIQLHERFEIVSKDKGLDGWMKNLMERTVLIHRNGMIL